MHQTFPKFQEPFLKGVGLYKWIHELNSYKTGLLNPFICDLTSTSHVVLRPYQDVCIGDVITPGAGGGVSSLLKGTVVSAINTAAGFIVPPLLPGGFATIQLSSPRGFASRPLCSARWSYLMTFLFCRSFDCSGPSFKLHFLLLDHDILETSCIGFHISCSRDVAPRPQPRPLQLQSRTESIHHNLHFQQIDANSGRGGGAEPEGHYLLSAFPG